MTCYIDTSAHANVYHSESACEHMRLLCMGKDVIRVSELTRAEFLSAP